METAKSSLMSVALNIGANLEFVLPFRGVYESGRPQTLCDGHPHHRANTTPNEDITFERDGASRWKDCSGILHAHEALPEKLVAKAQAHADHGACQASCQGSA